jgi:hypothetical protein
MSGWDVPSFNPGSKSTHKLFAIWSREEKSVYKTTPGDFFIVKNVKSNTNECQYSITHKHINSFMKRDGILFQKKEIVCLLSGYPIDCLILSCLLPAECSDWVRSGLIRSVYDGTVMSASTILIDFIVSED